MSESKPQFSRPMALFWLVRRNRTMVVALISGAAAFVVGAGTVLSLWIPLAGWFFATRPSPKLAHTLIPVYMMGQGILLLLAMILGSI